MSLPLTGIIYMIAGAAMCGQLFLKKEENRIWYQTYIMFAGLLFFVVGLEVTFNLGMEIATDMPKLVLALILGASGISVGFIWRSINRPT